MDRSGTINGLTSNQIINCDEVYFQASMKGNRPFEVHREMLTASWALISRHRKCFWWLCRFGPTDRVYTVVFQIMGRRQVSTDRLLGFEFLMILLLRVLCSTDLEAFGFAYKKMTNHCVSHYQINQHFLLFKTSLPSSSTIMFDGEVLELVWKNGRVIIRSKNEGSMVESPIGDRSTNRDSRGPVNRARGETQVDFPLVVDSTLENNFCDALRWPSQLRSTELYAGELSQVRCSHGMEFRQPMPRTEPVTDANGFGLFSKHTGTDGASSSNSKRKSPFVASTGGLGCRIMSDNVGRTTSLEDRKRKGKETVDSDSHHHHQRMGVDVESPDAKKQHLGSSSKRSRAADVHNLSERRRRDRINKKMKALQELMPHCTKTDKVSMLNEAIEYMKTLQLLMQMQTFSNGGMVPTISGGVQQVMPSMGMGYGMGMSMGMETTANRPMMPYPNMLPMMPYPNMLPGSTYPRLAGAAQLGQPFTYPAFHVAHVPNINPSIIQGTNQLEHMHNFSGMHNIYQPMVSSSLDGYQQFIASQLMHVPTVVSQPFAQNQPAAPLRTRDPHTSWGLESIDTHAPGSPTMDPC